MKKNLLDEKDMIFKTDPENMLAHIEELPEQIKDCWQQVKDFIIPPHYLNIKNIIILGMGGSAIGGDLVKSLALNKIKIPIYVIRDYTLPNFADNKSLVIASSYSGNTEETIESFLQAAQKGCKLLGITTGGQIEKICNSNNSACFKINYQSQPRAALGYSLTSIIGILAKLGILEISDKEINGAILEMIDLKRKISIQINQNKNQAKDLAKRVQNYIPLIIGSGILIDVARRYKTQINENSKQVAFYDLLPEMNHNTIVGLDFPSNLKDKIFILMLQSNYSHPRTKLREQILVEILGKKKIRFDTLIFTPSTSELGEMLKMIYFGDYLSYYLAILNEVNPTPVNEIKFLKDKLAKHQ